jgi:predicted nucleotidyltransferase
MKWLEQRKRRRANVGRSRAATHRPFPVFRAVLEAVSVCAMSLHLDLDRRVIAAFRRRHHIRRLAVFGSALREDFRPDSDVDLLVEFEPEHTPGLIRLGAMKRNWAGSWAGGRSW